MDHYSDPVFPPMPFITAELRELAEALKAAGYDEAEVIDADERNGPAIMDEVEDFVTYAASGDHLLLVLSGHGLHKDGSDFLVTGPARFGSRRFLDKCLRIEFGDCLRMDSDADQLVVAVDACRTEFDTYSKAGPEDLAWSKGAIGYEDTDALDAPRYAHVYACTRYGRAQFGPAAGPSPEDGRSTGDEPKGFSYFTRALTEIARDATAPGSLDAMEPLLDERVRTIAQEDRGHLDQCVQVNFATGKEGLVLFPGRGTDARRQAPEHPWQKLAVEHEAWRRVVCEQLDEARKAEAVAQVRDAVGRLVGLWGRDTDTAGAWLAEHGDIWRPAGSERRMSRGIAMMLNDSGPVPGRDGDRATSGLGLGLSLTEAALLVAGPFLYAAFGTRFAHLARGIRPWTLEDGTPGTESCGFADRAHFRRYCDVHLALKDRERRARQRGRDDEARAVAWWLARQWLLRLPATRGAVRRSGLAGLEVLPDGPEFEPPLVREVLAPARLWQLAELIGLDLEQPRLPEQDTVAAQDAAEHVVDWEKTGTLLTVAHHMAVDPMLLSSLVAEHLGISEPVDVDAFRAALEALTWLREGPRRRVLSTECPHPAVELALREHTDALDRTVRTVLHGPVGERALAWGVPAAVGAGKVKPALGDDGKPRYDTADVRFRLDGDRVRDLLMGEQLYQDRTLALRELYQNALDACRYRRARTELWNLRHPDDRDTWKGEIVFVQGEEDGRPYIECRDNGIGMGRHELRHLFAFAGSRFVEERKFLEERAEWAAEGIPFHANSRFGIGVLSYFMLADEIRVTTTRLDSNLLPGETLEVDIDGPGALFRIRPRGTRRQAGTAVRLYLRNPGEKVSCGEVMRKHLWVSDFAVRVEEGEKEPLVWRPGALSEYVGRDADPSATWRYEDGDSAPVQDAGDGVWWCGGRGAVLADGLWAGEPRFGCVVNLTGKHAPTLRLDRGAMLDDHEEHVAGLLAEKIPVLFDEGGGVLSLEWLHALTVGEWPEPGRRLPAPRGMPKGRQPQLADVIAAQAVSRGHRFAFRTREEAEMVADAAAVGCCPGDQELVVRTRTAGAAVVAGNSGVFEEWRARVWAAANPGAGVLPRSPLRIARPTDELLLNCVGESDGTPLPPGTVLTGVLVSGLPFAYVVDRMREFGLTLPDDEILERLMEVKDERLLSRDGDGIPPWLRPQDELNAAEARRIARRTGSTPREVVALLAGLGVRVPDDEEFDTVPGRWPPAGRDLERLVVRRHLDPADCELPRDQPVTALHLVLAVGAFPGQQDRIAEALTAAGYRIPPGALPERVEDIDLALISKLGDGRDPWISEDEPFPLHHVFRVSRETSVELLVERLAALGLTPPELPFTEERNTYRRLTDDMGAVYGFDRYYGDSDPCPVESDTVLDLARDNVLPEREVVRMLTDLGYAVRGVDEYPGQPRDHLDVVLMSRHQDGRAPWLDAERQVPWHHVVRAAHTRQLTPEEIVERLIRCGHFVAPEPSAEGWTHGDDLALLRRGWGSTAVWLAAGEPVPLTHILRTADHLNHTPTAVARRLEQLGHALPDDIEFAEPERP
ncbi:hypothetical protein ABT063_46935 [Streptomyces sp. NPDC002838]|uniref:wHTH domain-containing protein n=1 Tax=Streptomyces sp. NPDC002838 TaxID=3154436 RepID=UPI0033265A3D